MLEYILSLAGALDESFYKEVARYDSNESLYRETWYLFNSN